MYLIVITGHDICHCQRVEVIWSEKRREYNYIHLSHLPPLRRQLYPALSGLQLKSRSITIGLWPDTNRRTEEKKTIPFAGSSDQFHTMFLLESMIVESVTQLLLAIVKVKSYNVLLGGMYCVRIVEIIDQSSNVVWVIVIAICQ